MPNTLRLLLLVLTLICANPICTATNKPLNIATSIHPLGLMLSELTQETSVAIKVLIPPNQSGHDFSLRPKDIIGLNQADLIIWVGPELESFLHKPIQNLGNTQPNKVLTLLSAPAIKKQLLNLRSGAQWQDAHHHDHHDHHGDHTHHPHHSIDPHIWLSPELNLEIAKLVTQKLIALNPAQAKIYFNNFKAFTSQLLSIDKLYRQAFIENNHRYLVLHDSYQYIEKQYGLTVAGVLAIHPDRPASIKTLREAQQNIASNQVSCILGEPPFQAKLIWVLLEGHSEPKPKFVQLAPLADKFELKAGHFEKWQVEMVSNLRDCQ